MTKTKFFDLLWEEVENYYMNERYTANSIKKHMNNTVKDILKELRDHDPTIECAVCHKNKENRFFNLFWNEISELRKKGLTEKQIEKKMKEAVNDIISSIRACMRKSGMLPKSTKIAGNLQ